MTYAISVPTPFSEIGELAESFASRVDEERLMLPHSEAIPEGEWVQFAVTFADGSSALAGIARCSQCFDNGEDRAPEHRFDVVMDSLQLDEMGQVYFERILVVRATQMGAEPTTGELNVDELQAVPADAMDEPIQFDHEPAPPAYDEPLGAAEPDPYAAPPYDAEPQEAFAAPAYEESPSFDEAPVADAYAAPVEEPWSEPEPMPVEPAPAPSSPPYARSSERLAAPVNAIYELPPPTAPGMLPSPHANGAALTRRRIAASWSPEPAPRPDPSPSSGLFQYGDGGLPQPAHPPRPQLDPALRVMRAPRPGDPLALPMRAARVSAAAAAVAYVEEEAAALAQDEQAFAESEEYAQAEGYAYEEPMDVDAGEDGGELDTRQVDIGDLAEGEDDDSY